MDLGRSQENQTLAHIEGEATNSCERINYNSSSWCLSFLSVLFSITLVRLKAQSDLDFLTPVRSFCFQASWNLWLNEARVYIDRWKREGHHACCFLYNF